MELTEFERINVLIMKGYGDRKRSYQEVTDLFNVRFQNRPPISKSTVYTTVHRFDETRSVKGRAGRGRPKSVTNDDMSLNVLQSFVEDPHSSIRKVAAQNDISIGSVCNVLKRNNYYPYKMHLTHELSEDDFDRRIEFCDTMMQKLDINPNFVNSIVFTDESTFMLNGNVNRHNCRYWTDTNPHWMIEAHTQHPQKVNVWAGIVGQNIIGPFIIDGNLDGVSYHHMLINRIMPAIQNVEGLNFNSIWFQQDGAPPHYAFQVRNLLNQTLPRRWIGRRGPIEWPARSPDLSPLDYFFWGYLKNNVYKTRPNDINELTQRILHEAAEIPAEMLQNVMNGYYNRLAYCQTAEGKQFEHLL